MEQVISSDRRYRLELKGAWLYAYQNTPRTVTVTLAQSDGAVEQTQPLYQELFNTDDPDLFHARWEGGGEWETDIDCGAQRWFGTKKTAEVQKALRQMGFSGEQIRRMTQLAQRSAKFERPV